MNYFMKIKCKLRNQFTQKQLFRFFYSYQYPVHKIQPYLALVALCLRDFLVFWSTSVSSFTSSSTVDFLAATNITSLAFNLQQLLIRNRWITSYKYSSDLKTAEQPSQIGYIITNSLTLNVAVDQLQSVLYYC